MSPCLPRAQMDPANPGSGTRCHRIRTDVRSDAWRNGDRIHTHGKAHRGPGNRESGYQHVKFPQKRASTEGGTANRTIAVVSWIAARYAFRVVRWFFTARLQLTASADPTKTRRIVPYHRCPIAALVAPSQRDAIWLSTADPTDLLMPHQGIPGAGRILAQWARGADCRRTKRD